MLQGNRYWIANINPDWQEGDPYHFRIFRVYSENQPGIQQVVQELRQVAEEYRGRVLIGEIYLPYKELVRYYGENLSGIHLPFNFQLIMLTEWKAEKVKTLVDSYEAILPVGAWPNWVLGNHDNPRPASRLGPDQARVAQMLLLTLRGTPTCYYGDELGMHNVKVPPELAHDPQEKSSPGFGRDPVRTPMQWDSTPNAGFSSPEAIPWLPISEDYKVINVEKEKQDTYSMLNLVHKLIGLRKENLALHSGDYRAVNCGTENCFGYIRHFENQTFLIILNFSDENQNLSLPQLREGRIVLLTHLDREGPVSLSNFKLRSTEGLVIRV